MAKTVVIGCKLPHGLIIELPTDTTKKVTLNGRNKAVIVGAEYATTEVDSDFWDTWLALNAEFPAVKSGTIFVAKNATDAAAIATETAERETGFEPLRQDGKDKRARGVKVATTKDE